MACQKNAYPPPLPCRGRQVSAKIKTFFICTSGRLGDAWPMDKTLSPKEPEKSQTYGAVDPIQASKTDMAPLEEFFCDHFPPKWMEMASSLYMRLIHIKPPIAEPHKLAEYAVLQTHQLAQDFGGHQFYMPKGVHFNAQKMAENVRREYRVDNLRQLSIKWGVSEMRIRQIVGPVTPAKGKTYEHKNPQYLSRWYPQNHGR